MRQPLASLLAALALMVGADRAAQSAIDVLGAPAVASALPLLQGRADAADWIRRLREAALKDEAGTMLDGALKTVATLDTSPLPEG